MTRYADTGMVSADGSVEWENHSDLPDDVVYPSVREVASQIESWVREKRAERGSGNLWQRAKYVASDNPYDVIRTARAAVENDDIVGGAADATEGLILQGVTFESRNRAVTDIFNQLAKVLNLDGYLRSAYREIFTESQTVTASLWGRRSFKPTTESVAGKVNKDGSQRKYPPRKSYDLYVPTQLVSLDSLMVVPIGQALFGEDRLAWHATGDLVNRWTGAEMSPTSDPLLAQLFTGRYAPSKEEEERLMRWGVDPMKLMEFRSDRVWRRTRTKSTYEPFAKVRMKSIFRHLDMKQSLMESDRVMLLGSANYILLVKKGTDQKPGLPEEIENLKQGFQVIAKLPVIVSDHRLNIEIITPDLSHTLAGEKYDVLDERILSRLFVAMAANDSARGDQASGSTSRMVARFLESTRLMLRRMIEEKVVDAVWGHPANREALSKFSDDDRPNLTFQPRNVQVDNDSQVIQAVMSARESRDLSRESFLDFFGYDQSVEAQRMEYEDQVYDAIFKTHVPFSSPDGGSPRVDGARGGRPQGGGSPSRSTQGRVERQTTSGAPSTGGN